MNKYLPIIPICALLLCTASGAQANSKQRLSPQLLVLMQQASANNKVADSKMHSQMERVAKCVRSFYRRHHHFPEPGTEQDQFLASLSTETINNPYYEDPLLRSALQNPSTAVRYQLRVCLAVSPTGIHSQLAAILSDCHEPCGTVGILHNSESAFIVWAAGTNERPLLNATTGDADMIFEDLSK